jgi:quercetin dioxygenase-like cupin family protein/DNA-binding CsgD family transcriptional regulator
MASLKNASSLTRKSAAEPLGLAREADILQPCGAPTALKAFNALDDASYGILLLNRSGQVILANAPGRLILTAGDAIGEHEGNLRAAVPSAQTTLRAAVEAAVCSRRENGTRAFMMSRSRKGPLIIVSVPLVTSAIVDTTGLLLLYDLEMPTSVSAAQLHELFGLSQAECDLCESLAMGCTLTEFARSRGVSPNTARTLLARTFEKTGKKRQSDLVRMLACLSSVHSLGTAFAAGNATTLLGLGVGDQEAMLKLSTLAHAETERFPNLEATVTTGEYTPGGVNKRHAHLDCLEIIFVIQGAISTQIEGEGTTITRAGEVICIQPDILHRGRNASGSDPAKLVIVKLKKRGAATTA